MSAVAKKVSATEEDVFNRALSGLKTSKKIKELTELLDQDKGFLREVAGGETLTLEVPGWGKVQVKKPPAASSGEVLVFNEEKYSVLPNETKTLLLSLGVVEKKAFSKPEGTASVTFTLNA